MRAFLLLETRTMGRNRRVVSVRSRPPSSSARWCIALLGRLDKATSLTPTARQSQSEDVGTEHRRPSSALTGAVAYAKRSVKQASTLMIERWSIQLWEGMLDKARTVDGIQESVRKSWSAHSRLVEAVENDETKRRSYAIHSGC
jgi:hypothetical protein